MSADVKSKEGLDQLARLLTSTRAAYVKSLLDGFNLLHVMVRTSLTLGWTTDLANRFPGEIVALHIGYDLPYPIEDFVLDEEGFEGVFSFARTPYFLRVPWLAVTSVSIPLAAPPNDMSGYLPAAAFPAYRFFEEGGEEEGEGASEKPACHLKLID